MKYKIDRVTLRKKDDRESVAGHVAFKWVPDELDEIVLQRYDAAEKKSKNCGRIEGVAKVVVFDAAIVWYADTNSGEIKYLLGLDGMQLPRDVSDAIVADAVAELDKLNKDAPSGDAEQ